MECEIFHSGFPFVTEFDENGSDESEQGCFVGEESGDSGTAFEFSVLSFEHVGGPHSFSVLSGDSENRQSFGDVGFGPGSQLGSGVFVSFDKAAEFFGGVVGISSDKDVADIIGDLFSQFDFGRMLHRVLSQMELATLPWDTRERGLASGFESLVSVADNELHSVQSTLLE